MRQTKPGCFPTAVLYVILAFQNLQSETDIHEMSAWTPIDFQKITVFLTGVPHLCLPDTHTIDLCFFLFPHMSMQMRPLGSVAQPRRAEIDQFNHTVSSEREHLHCKRKWKYTHTPIDVLWGGWFVIFNCTDRPAGSRVQSLFGKSSLGPSGYKNNRHLQILEKTVCKTWWINYLAAAEMINCGTDQRLHSKKENLTKMDYFCENVNKFCKGFNFFIMQTFQKHLRSDCLSYRDFFYFVSFCSPQCSNLHSFMLL